MKKSEQKASKTFYSCTSKQACIQFNMYFVDKVTSTEELARYFVNFILLLYYIRQLDFLFCHPAAYITSRRITNSLETTIPLKLNLNQ